MDIYHIYIWYMPYTSPLSVSLRRGGNHGSTRVFRVPPAWPEPQGPSFYSRPPSAPNLATGEMVQKWSFDGGKILLQIRDSQGFSTCWITGRCLDVRVNNSFFRDFKKIKRTDAWLFGGMGDPRFTKRSWSVKSPELDASAGYCSHVIPKTKSIKGYSVLEYQVLASWSPCNQDF